MCVWGGGGGEGGRVCVCMRACAIVFACMCDIYIPCLDIMLLHKCCLYIICCGRFYCFLIVVF